MIQEQESSERTRAQAKQGTSWMRTLGLCVLSVLIVLTYFVYLNTPPTSFSKDALFSIPEGSSIGTIGSILHESGFIRSTILYKFFVRTRFDSPRIQAGSYYFDKPLTTYKLIRSLITGDSQSPFKKITFPEGFSVYDMRSIVGSTFADIDTESLVESEGYLFPETYFVSLNETLPDLTLRMQDEYTRAVDPLRPRIASSGLTEKEVIILASILEREANDITSMRTVSGILQKRLNDDMPLQVDAVFGYILGKTSAELTLDDLALDSPYNTYTNRGLPPTPISNPGLMAINAVLDPLLTEYLFYLTDTDGNFHYAETFEEHKENKARYLR